MYWLLGAKAFLLCEAVCPVDLNDGFMYDSESPSRCHVTGMKCLQLSEVVAANDKVAVRGFC